MAIAITPFSGFCGFLPPKDINTYLTSVPEFASLVGPELASLFASVVSSTDSASPEEEDKIPGAIKQVFGRVMESPSDIVKETIGAIISRYQTGDVTSSEEPLKDLVLTLDSQFPGDVGILCAYLLNVVHLEVGQAVFLKADEPHAYISGGKHLLTIMEYLTKTYGITCLDIIETMATSGTAHPHASYFVRAHLAPYRQCRPRRSHP